MALVVKTTGKIRQYIKSNTKLVTKLFDFNDPSMTKSFSRMSITYSIDGTGIAPLSVWFKLNHSPTWTRFKDPNNYYSTKGHKIKRTSGKLKQFHYDFPKKSIGTKVQIKLGWSAMYANSTSVKNFELSNISFTYRGLNRK